MVLGNILQRAPIAVSKTFKKQNQTEQWIGGYLILDRSIYIGNSAIDGLSGQTIGQKRQYIWNNLRQYLGVLVKMFGLEVLEGPKNRALLLEKLKLK